LNFSGAGIGFVDLVFGDQLLFALLRQGHG
jgi:hypothetical protein